MSAGEDRPFGPEFDQDDGRRRSRVPAWLALLALGFLVFELTAEPALGVLVACLKFGLEDFRTAIWLRRVDPHRARGRASLWFYATHGIFRVGATALAVLILIVLLVGPITGGPGPPPPVLFRQFIAAVLTIFGCSALASLTAIAGMGSAIRSKVRIWVGKEAHRARRAGVWPPLSATNRPRTGNAAGIIVLWSVISGVLIFSLTMSLGSAIVLPMLVGPNFWVGRNNPVAIGWLLVSVLSAPAAVVIGLVRGQRLRNEIVANWPWEAYPEIILRESPGELETPARAFH